MGGKEVNRGKNEDLLKARKRHQSSVLMNARQRERRQPTSDYNECA